MRFAIVAGLLAISAVAHAERPRPMKIDIGRVTRPPGAAPSSRIIYMHRCSPTSCTITQGDDDSRLNRSSIAQGTRVLSEFTQPDNIWNALMACMHATFAPFDIQVTDVDPGNVPHYENMVGGSPTELRDDIPNAGGVAPFACGEIPNSISYTFDVYGPDADTLCWTSAQEVAHAFGLEHEVNNKDPMTYLAGPLPKRFQATDSQCGEFSPRACDCGGTTQNSYMHILGMFGPGLPTPPMLTIKSPAPGKQVQPRFVTKVDATDDVAIERVELWIDGTKITEKTAAPYWLTAPADIALGPHSVEVRGYDVQGTEAKVAFDVDVGPPCTASSGCTGDDVCVMGVCVPGPDVNGGLGMYCNGNSECLSLQCAMSSEGKACVESCDLSPGSCPEGFSCIAAGAGGVCWRDESSGCCSTSRSTLPAGPALFALGVLALLVRPRRPRRPRLSGRPGRLRRR